MITYATRCPFCGSDVEAEISVEPEQQGGPETEYLPEHWELVELSACCGYEFVANAQVILDDASRYYGT